MDFTTWTTLLFTFFIIRGGSLGQDRRYATTFDKLIIGILNPSGSPAILNFGSKSGAH